MKIKWTALKIILDLITDFEDSSKFLVEELQILELAPDQVTYIFSLLGCRLASTVCNQKSALIFCWDRWVHFNSLIGPLQLIQKIHSYFCLGFTSPLVTCHLPLRTCPEDRLSCFFDLLVSVMNLCTTSTILSLDNWRQTLRARCVLFSIGASFWAVWFAI